MPPTVADSAERAARDKAAYDEGDVLTNSHAWNTRVHHVFDGPNTQRAEAMFERMLDDKAAGSRVLDIGCGHGQSTQKAIDAGARYALGVEVSQMMVDGAQQRAVPGRIEFRLADVQQPLDGTFDLIMGRSVLHHIDYREVLPRLYRDNLAPGGRMIFMEPCAHPMTVAFHLLVPSAHTPDEFTLLPRDIGWMRGEFPEMKVFPVNLLSFPAGVVSSFTMSDPDNPLTRAADRADQALQRRRRLSAFGRQGIIIVDRPAAAH